MLFKNKGLTTVPLRDRGALCLRNHAMLFKKSKYISYYIIIKIPVLKSLLFIITLLYYIFTLIININFIYFNILIII